MGFWDAINHLLNFFAPAAALAVVLQLGGRFLEAKWPKTTVLCARAAIVFVACCVSLLAGLFVFGRDGKMATYGLMVLAAATAQWLVQKGWKA